MTDSDLREIVYRAVESDELDYKAHQSWNAMSRVAKAKIVRHLVALANTKGGYIVVGVGEDAAGYPAVYTGLTDEECRSFDPTAVGNFVAECVEPPVDFTIERPVIDGRRYAVFIVRPFAALPHVCSRGVENELRSGVFYIRTAAASSRPAYRAVEMHALIQRALRNQREMLGRMLRGLLYENRSTAPGPVSGFSDAMTAAVDYFRRRRPVSGDGRSVLLQLSAHPDKFKSGLFDLETLRRAAVSAWRLRPGPRLIRDGEPERARRTNVSLRLLAEDAPRMWQLFDSGLFHFVAWLPVPEDRLDFAALRRMVIDAASFAGRLYAELDFTEELITLECRLDGTAECRLDGPGIPDGCRCRSPEVAVALSRSAADLISGGRAHAARLLRRIAEAFAVPDKVLAGLEQVSEAAWEER